MILQQCFCSCLHLVFIAQMKLRDFFSFVELQCRYHCIPCYALVDTHQSSFQRLYNSHNGQAFITFTGLDIVSFQYLLAKFEPLYFRYSPYSVNGKMWEWGRMLLQRVGLVCWVRLIVLVWFLETPRPQDPYMLCRWCLDLMSLFKVFYEAVIEGVDCGGWCKGCSSICTRSSRVWGSC